MSRIVAGQGVAAAGERERGVTEQGPPLPANCAGPWHLGVSYRWVLGVFLVEAVVLAVLQLPVSQDFKLFAFYDPGSALKADGLLAAGLRPTVDFAYSYGLLPLWVGQGWFGVFGRTPMAYGVLTFLGALVLAWGLARFFVGQFGEAEGRGPWQSLGLFVVAMPYAIVPFYLNQTHVMEAGLLVHALAEQSRGRRGRALVLAAICGFVKPSMVYVYGMLVVGCMIVEGVRQRQRVWQVLRQMVPAGVAGGVVAGVMGWVYGWVAVVHTLLPLNASKSYKAAHFGFFFGVGREFWWPSTCRGLVDWVWYYVFTEAGFWIAATVVVTGMGVWLFGRALGQSRGTLDVENTFRGGSTLAPARGGAGLRSKSAAIEALLCVVALHLVFVFFLYAWKGSWTYYPYLLVMALVGMLGRVNWAGRRWLIGAMAALAIAGQVTNASLLQGAWRWKVRGADTSGLSGYEDLVLEWTQVRGKIAGRGEFLLTNGYVDRLAVPPLKGVESWFMSPALQTGPEIARLKRAIGGAEVVVRWNELDKLDPWLWEELRDETAGFEVEWRGTYLTIMKRRAAALR